MSKELKPCQHCASTLGPFVAAPDGKPMPDAPEVK